MDEKTTGEEPAERRQMFMSREQNGPGATPNAPEQKEPSNAEPPAPTPEEPKPAAEPK